MTSSTEMFTGKAVNRKIAFGSERNLYIILPLHKQGSKIDIPDRKSIINYSFSIAVLVVKPFKIVFCKNYISRVEFRKNVQSSTYSISQKS